MDRELLALIPEGYEENGYEDCLIHGKEHKAIRLIKENSPVLLLCYEHGLTYERGEDED